jgi:phosphoglycolate phosphatase
VLIKKIMGGCLPDLIMLDLDGTLVDSVPSLALAINDMLALQAVDPVDEDLVRAWVGNGASKLVERALAQVALDVSFDEAYNAFLAAYQHRLSERLVLYSGVIEFLNQARSLGIRLMVVTNKPSAFTLPVLQAVSIDKYFEGWVCGDTFSKKKPDPMPIIETLGKFDLHHTNALFIGDSVNDQYAAEAASVAFCGVPYGYNHGKPLNAQWIVESLSDLF